MKKLNSLTSKLFILGSLAVLSLTQAQAATQYWATTGGGTFAGNNWTTAANGTGTKAGFASGNDAIIDATNIAVNNNLALTIAANTTVDSLTFLGTGVHTGTTAITSTGGTARTMTLGGTSLNIITVDAGAGAVTIGSTTAANGVNIQTSGKPAGTTFVITNNSTLNIDNTVTAEIGGAAGSSTISVGGSGTTTFAGAITDQATNKNTNILITAGTTTLTGTSTYTGTTTVDTGSTLNLTGGDLGATAITTSGTLNQTSTSVISGAASLTVNGGTTTLNSGSNNTFTGTTTVNSGGTLLAEAADAVSSTSVTVNGGTLTISAGGALNNATTVLVENGGTLTFGNVTNGVASGATITSSGTGTNTLVANGSTETIGTLTLAAGSNTVIELSGSGTLTINAISWAAGATLTIDGWTGNSITGGLFGDESLDISSGAATTLTANSDQLLNQIVWTNASLNFNNPAEYDSTSIIQPFGGTRQLVPGGTPVTPAPEPSTVFLGLGLLALLAWGGRQQLLEAGRNLTLVRA